MRLPYRIKFEPRTKDVPKWLPFATSMGAVIVAFIISGIVYGYWRNPSGYRYSSVPLWQLGAFSDI